MNWDTIIENNSLRNRIENKIDQIADSLEAAYDKQNSLGLLYGKGGIILFFCYYNLYKNTDRFNSKIAQFVDELGKTLKDSKSMDFSYSRGLPGIFWLIHFLKADFIDADNWDNRLINVVFKKTEKKISEEKDLDFLHGSLGNIFFLNEINKDKKILTLLKGIKSISKENARIFIPCPSVTLQDGKKVHNLGLAHGIPGFIIILCNLYNKYRTEEIKSMIEKSTAFLLSTRNIGNSKKFKSKFPSYIFITKKKSSTSRLAWCYGDMGVALAIYRASLILGSEKLYQEAMSVFIFNMKRKVLNDTFISDAEFCHGSSGIAHIYNRLYQETKNTEYKTAAIHWYKKTLTFATSAKSCAGYKTVQRYGSTEEYGFLEGISGIGLSLISSISNIEPKWDKSLLIS